MIPDNSIEILSERIISKSNTFIRKIRWLRGSHPTLGTIIKGLTGIETLQEVEMIMSIATFVIS